MLLYHRSTYSYHIASSSLILPILEILLKELHARCVIVRTVYKIWNFRGFMLYIYYFLSVDFRQFKIMYTYMSILSIPYYFLCPLEMSLLSPSPLLECVIQYEPL